MQPLSKPFASKPTIGITLLRLPLLLGFLLMIGACGMEIEPPDHPPNPAPDLRVLQEPNDTVRVGSTVRFTALFADSLRGYKVIWRMTDKTTKFGRIVEWQAPSEPGTYYNSVSVNAGVNDGTTYLKFATYVTQ